MSAFDSESRMFEEVTEILMRASRYDFRLLPLYAECQSVADETQRLLGGRSHPGSADGLMTSAASHDRGIAPNGETFFRKHA